MIIIFYWLILEQRRKLIVLIRPQYRARNLKVHSPGDPGQFRILQRKRKEVVVKYYNWKEFKAFKNYVTN